MLGQSKPNYIVTEIFHPVADGTVAYDYSREKWSCVPFEWTEKIDVYNSILFSKRKGDLDAPDDVIRELYLDLEQNAGKYTKTMQQGGR